MNTDIRVDISLPRHWKYRKLKRMLGCSPMEYLIVFWATVAEQKPNGALNGWSTDDIEDAAGWEGERGAMCQSFLECGFLDTTADGYYPHDWAEHQPWAIGAKERSEAARRAGKASAESRKKNGKKGLPPDTQDERNGNAPLTDGSTDAERNSNPRTPSPSPSPSEDNDDNHGERRESVIFERIREAYNVFCPDLPKASFTTSDRYMKIKRLFERYKDHDGGAFGFFDALFKRAQASDRLTNRDGQWRGLPCNIDWLLEDKNYVKVIEGYYDNGTVNEKPPKKKGGRSCDFESRFLAGD